ncbi:beta-TrCP isoform X1 [Histomonas meleagridis]|nr:beta-TrCP isoform X1 [Histomonas meleagridis]
MDNENITQIDPKDWKIVTAAYIFDNQHYIYADSFGTLTFALENYFEVSTDSGAIFGIDYNPQTRDLITAHEFHTASLWKVHDVQIEKIKTFTNYTSRVWGAKFLPIGPITYGEDGCIHLLDESEMCYHLHRIKNITAFDAIGNEVVTGGQDGILRHFTLYKNGNDVQIFQFTNNKSSKDPKFPLSISFLQNGDLLYGTVDGTLALLPQNEIILGPSEEVFGWHLIQTKGNFAFGASRSRHHFFYDGINVHVFGPTPNACISLAISEFFLSSVYSNNTLIIRTLDGNEVLNMSISDYFLKPPMAISMHPTMPIIALGSHASRIVVLEFEEGYQQFQSSSILTSVSNDGFRCITFLDDHIYFAGRSDGLVTIVGQMDQYWHIKTVWRIPNQCRSTAHIQSVGNSVVVTAITKDSIALWDMTTQTMLGKHKVPSQHSIFAITMNDFNHYSVAWLSEGSIKLFQHQICVPAISFGIPFHGLRGLCMTKCGNLVITGSCDRDIRLWKIIDNEIFCVDLVQSIDFGTHAICFDRNNSILYSGGSKGYLYIWKYYNERLFRIASFVIGDNPNKYQMRITSLSICNEKLFVGLSNASILTYRFINDELEMLDRLELNGVPISSTVLNEVVGIVTSTGYVYFIVEGENPFIENISIDCCGLHCVKLFKYNDRLFAVTAGEAVVAVWEVTFQPLNVVPKLQVEGAHQGGIKAVTIKAEQGTLLMLTFSYDQKVNIYKINPEDFQIQNQFESMVPVADGEAAEFVEEGFVVFGSSIYFMPHK